MTYRIFLLIFLFLLLEIPPLSAQKEKQKVSTISGKITDSQNGETLIGATIYITEKKTGTVSDLYGNYSISLLQGQYTLTISYIGYGTVKKMITLDKDITLNIELSVK
jgi:hypothetical protein